MAYHHEPEKAPSFNSEVAIIALADILANSRDNPEYLDDDRIVKYCNQLSITQEEWAEHEARLSEVWSEVDQFWNLLAT